MSLDRVVAAFDAAGCKPRRSGKGYAARCPVHDDNRPSMSINPADNGGVVVFCHVCGKAGTPDILQAVGLTMADLGDNGTLKRQTSRARRIVARYRYGELEKVRYEPKFFAWRRPDGRGGWLWGRGGQRPPLYRLDSIQSAPDATVFVVEGEADADRLADAGLVATCNGDGAGKWGGVDDRPLHGRHVVIIPDADKPGRQHADDVAHNLHGKAASLRVVELPGVDEGGDVSDWLDAGHDVEDLDRLAAATPERQPGLPPPPYRNGRESMQAARATARKMQTCRRTLIDVADEVREWFDRRGDAEMTRPNGKPVEHPVGYYARMLGVSRPRLYQLRDFARVRHLLMPTKVDTGDVYPVDTDEVPEKVLRPLSRLLAADREDDVLAVVNGGPKARLSGGCAHLVLPAAHKPLLWFYLARGGHL